ncbi:hypothetical protein CY34DRAFT_19486 [Suillus luteus UH-Slu-Lm8-n1]|uniref:Uncharacterized protein n=1 Tax=Suillus luteus UH-Slu-Lm8-n1 TaxID=930992 RepID=A0A0C9Z358_9AGAM|nr:hypothetical protein CY34DRAFT_19486 [Suillus luteus UH-Slu-Lm8-n1]
MLSAPISTLPPSCSFESFFHEGSVSDNHIFTKPDQLSSILGAVDDIEKQNFILSLDAVDISDDEQDKLFAMYSIDTVHSSYLASKSRVRLYTQFVSLLKRTEEAWSKRLQETGCVALEQKLHKTSLDGIEVEGGEQDKLLKCAVDAVLAHYVTAQYRVRQYTQFLTILKREEDAWAQSYQRASCVMPDYSPATLKCQ